MPSISRCALFFLPQWNDSDADKWTDSLGIYEKASQAERNSFQRARGSTSLHIPSGEVLLHPHRYVNARACDSFDDCRMAILTRRADITMPVMDGLEATRRIREFERARNLPPVIVIAITSLGSVGARQEGFASGMDLFLTRPVTMTELVKILKQRKLVDETVEKEVLPK